LQNGRFFSYLNTAEKLVSGYHGDLPFHHYLRAFFRENAKYGSKDRKQISKLCYAYYRTGNALSDHPVKDKILASLFLCSEEQDPVLNALKPEWTAQVEYSLEEKISFLEMIGFQLRIPEVFPLFERISELIPDADRFVLSHLVQPRLFLRVRPGREETVESGLRKAGIPYNLFDHTIELANSTDILNVLATDKDVVVQDLSSQRTARFLERAIRDIGPQARVWDCCAASGGKSIMAFDIEPSIELSVSDIRNSILENLSERFKRAGIKKFHSFVADLTVQERSGFYGVVMADVPCSGSGTWGRTPEEMCFFSSPKLERYTETQFKIVKNVSRNVKPGGSLLYLTCSVFRDENEGMVERIVKETKLELQSMELVGGWETRADTMFMALFHMPARS
jgi:16S rRNA (cytosine967-C5)-methyltransferase